jgi:hypothetical protein
MFGHIKCFEFDFFLVAMMEQLQYFGIDSFRLQPVRRSQGAQSPWPFRYRVAVSFVTSDQKNQQLPAALGASTGGSPACIDTQFGNTVPQIAVITRMAFGEPTDAGQDASACGYVLESVNPCRELTGTLDLHGGL